jgi:colicin import membrane protein
MGDSKDLYEYIFEFYTDYENLKDQFEDKWSQYIRYVSNTSQKPKSKKKSVSDTLEDADALAEKEKKLEEEFKKKEEALKKAAIKEYKEAEAKKKEEAKLKAEEEKKRKEEEAKRKEQEESESLGGLFDLL